MRMYVKLIKLNGINHYFVYYNDLDHFGCDLEGTFTENEKDTILHTICEKSGHTKINTIQLMEKYEFNITNYYMEVE